MCHAPNHTALQCARPSSVRLSSECDRMRCHELACSTCRDGLILVGRITSQGMCAYINVRQSPQCLCATCAQLQCDGMLAALAGYR